MSSGRPSHTSGMISSHLYVSVSDGHLLQHFMMQRPLDDSVAGPDVMGLGTIVSDAK